MENRERVLAPPAPSEFASIDQAVEWSSLKHLESLAYRSGNSECTKLFENTVKEYMRKWVVS